MRKLLFIVVVGAVSLAACGSGSGVIASTVNGQDISVGEVEALMETEGSVVAKEDFARFLAYQIQWVIINMAAESDFGVTTTEEDVTAEADRIMADVVPEGETREDFLSSRGLTEEFLRNIARQGLLDTAIRAILVEDVAEPTTEEIDAQLEASISALTSVCASHILVATQEEAEDVVTRLEDGEDFADLAMELSTDTGSGANGGALGCASPDTYVESFAEATRIAPLGEVYEEIVESSFGFHVIMVTEREVPADEDLPTEDEMVEVIKEEAILVELEEWFLGALSDAEVTVAADYGTWEANPPTVVPPAD